MPSHASAEQLLKRLSLFCLFLITLFFSGCGLWGSEPQKSADIFVLSPKHAPLQDETYAHPATLQASFIGNVLKELNVQNETRTVPIFAQSDIASIAEDIATELGRIDEEEVLAFQYRGNTSGIIFVDEDGNLNFRFSTVSGTDGEKIYIVMNSRIRHKIISTLLSGDIAKKNWIWSNERIIKNKKELSQPETIELYSRMPREENSEKRLRQRLQETESIEKKIIFLQELYKKGYITKDDFKTMKRELLNRL